MTKFKSIVVTMKKHPDKWIDLMMKCELRLEKPDASRARNSAIRIAITYIFGGLIPLLPYFCMSSPIPAIKSYVQSITTKTFLYLSLVSATHAIQPTIHLGT